VKRLFFVNNTWVFILVVFILYSFKHFGLVFPVTLLGVSMIAGYIFRRRFVPYRDTLKNDGEIYLCPVHGEIQSIRKGSDGKPEIRIAMSLFDEKGLYLPTPGEITYLKDNRGKRVPRLSPHEYFYGSTDHYAHTDVSLISKNRITTQMRFIDAPYSKRPKIWLKSGDRGRGAACFGYYPFGGTLIIYLPVDSDILVFEKERVIPGQTVLAALKNPQ
jgi:hypothetical protein